MNVHKADNCSLLAACIKENGINAAVLSEAADIDFNRLIEILGERYVHIDTIGCDKLKLVAVKDLNACIVRVQSRFFICRVQSGGNEMLLTGVHLQDR